MTESPKKTLAQVLRREVRQRECADLLQFLKTRLVPGNAYKLLGVRFFPMVGEDSRKFEANNWSGLLSRAFRSLLSAST